MLLIYFNDNYQLQIANPSSIYYTNSYRKIIKAKEIKWQVRKDNKLVDIYHYCYTGSKITTTSNTSWKPMPTLGIGMNALYLQN
ncbi:hypothetical protein [Zunongwangia sp.]|uniref:hypothetical protein n=1 Tax=Zunongwangia sp. TaxID=1965325 RepID=UPI003AA8159C